MFSALVSVGRFLPWGRSGSTAWRHVHLPALNRYLVLRRRIDVVLALALLIATAPVMLVAMLLVKLTSPGPVIYSQIRLGLRGRRFTIYKIRTMEYRCEDRSGPRWCQVADPRVTFVGRILRKSKIDELPQLWNVIRGDMSILGPRPERPELVAQLERQIPRYANRLLVPPGLSGLAQVQLPPDTSIESVRCKLALDLYYVHNVSWKLDVQIVLATVCFFLGLPFAWIARLVRLPDVLTTEVRLPANDFSSWRLRRAHVAIEDSRA